MAKKKAAKKKRAKGCDCLKQVNGELKDYNTRVETDFMPLGRGSKTMKLTDSPPRVATKKLNPRRRQPAKVVYCSYCPFCGTKYPEEPQ